MEPRVSIVTLGVSDLDRAKAFYEALGLKPGMVVEGDVAFFQMGGLILGLWMREKLAADIGSDGFAGGPAPVALAYNTRSEAEVDALLARAEKAGGRVVKPAQKAFYGGWYGYFADPDGHLWEIAHNPGFPLDEEGRISLPA
ncbi:MAG TPA: VOC family protein [Mesorhizobium sp.]|nr:VOC family protein [Mesorhizobium sp.]